MCLASERLPDAAVSYEQVPFPIRRAVLTDEPKGDLPAYQITPRSTQGFVVRRAGGALVRTVYDDANPTWAPDGHRLAAFIDYASDLVVLPLSGGKGRILMGGYALRDPSWSPDGTASRSSRRGRTRGR